MPRIARLVIGVALLLTGCGSALQSSGSYPDVRILSDVLTPTGGPPVRVDDAWSRTEAFAVRNLPGWTVETAAASRAPAVTFRQGPCTAITVAPYPHPTVIPEACEDVPLRVVLRGTTVAEQTILIVAMAPEADWAATEPAFAAVARAVTEP